MVQLSYGRGLFTLPDCATIGDLREAIAQHDDLRNLADGYGLVTKQDFEGEHDTPEDKFLKDDVPVPDGVIYVVQPGGADRRAEMEGNIQSLLDGIKKPGA